MEPFYTPKEIAEHLKLSTDKVIRLFEKEPGVMVIENRGTPWKRRYRTLRIPESVLERVQQRLSNPDLTRTRTRAYSSSKSGPPVAVNN